MIQITIILRCTCCQSTNIKKNGKKNYDDKQNYQCKDCKRQFVGDHNLTYKGCHSGLGNKIKKMFVRGFGIRDIAAIEDISISKVLSTLVGLNYSLKPKQCHYESLEIDEFHTFVGSKKNKMWLIYAYSRASKEIVCYVWGRRNHKPARRLRQKLFDLGISFDVIFSDGLRAFVSAFRGLKHIIGKKNTVGIEGNNCLLRHRIKRAFRRTCNFSKKLINHIKAFELAFYYINWGRI